MENINKYLVWTVVVVIIVAVTIYFRDGGQSDVREAGSLATSTELGSSSINTGSVESDIGSGTVLTVDSPIQIPDLNRNIFTSDAHDKAIQDKIVLGISNAIKELKVNSSDISAWLNLAMWRKISGDYEGAEHVWIYLTKINPDNKVAYNNLGDLYRNFTKEYAKAEAMWLKVIALEPTLVQAYSDLHHLYRYNIPVKKSEAEKILITGINKTKSADLMLILASFYRDLANKTSAREWYNKAKVVAQSAKNTALVKSIEQELSSLK